MARKTKWAAGLGIVRMADGETMGEATETDTTGDGG
jgi:hypothetical protein